MELLLTANQRLVSRMMAATHPARYVRGAVREQIAASSIQEKQERMVEIDSSDYAGEPLEAVHGTRTECYSDDARRRRSWHTPEW